MPSKGDKRHSPSPTALQYPDQRRPGGYIEARTALAQAAETALPFPLWRQGSGLDSPARSPRSYSMSRNDFGSLMV